MSFDEHRHNWHSLEEMGSFAIARVFSFVCKVILFSLALKRDLDGLGTEKTRPE